MDMNLWLRNHLNQLKGIYALNQLSRGPKKTHPKGRSKYVPFFPSVAHANSFPGREMGMSDYMWREQQKLVA